jgi:hypothetical protein
MSEPKRRGRPPKAMAQPTDRLAALTAREKALALRATARHRYTFDLPLELYESLLTEAESWGQPLPDVVRACIRSGLDSIKRFGGASSANPFAYGSLNPPTQADLDPSGLAYPPTHGQVPHTPQWLSPDFPNPQINNAPPPMQIIPPSLRGLVPNGFTTQTGEPASDDAAEPSQVWGDESR